MKKRHLPFLVAILLCAACTEDKPLPQAPAYEHTFGGAGNEVAGDILRLPDGGFLIVGGKQDPKDKNYDLYILKVDASGNEVLSHKHGDENSDEVGWKIAPTTLGEYAILGTKQTKGVATSQVQITLIDADLNVRWQTTSSLTTAANQLTLHGANFYELQGGGFMAGFATDYFPVSARFDNRGLLLDDSPRSGYNSDKFAHTFCRGLDSTFVHFTTNQDYNTNGIIIALTYDAYGNYQSERAIGVGIAGTYIRVQAATGLPDGGYLVSIADQSVGGHVIGFIDQELTDGQYVARASAPDYDEVLALPSGKLLFTGNGGNYNGGYGSSGDFQVLLCDSLGADIRAASYGGQNVESLRGVAAIPTGGAALLGETQSYGAGGSDLYLVFFKE
jgi:hypothetical protein